MARSGLNTAGAMSTVSIGTFGGGGEARRRAVAVRFTTFPQHARAATAEEKALVEHGFKVVPG